MTQAASTASALDASAISLSGLCVVHCLALPVAAAFLPAMGVVAEAEWVHKSLALLALPISLLAMARSRGGRGASTFTALAAVGLVLLLSAAFIEALHDLETPLTVLGGVALASAHVVRWRRHI